MSASPPLWYLAGLSGFPDITVLAQDLGSGAASFDYSGWPEDLIAAGVMQPEWITPTGKHLRDSDGAAVTVVRRWRVISPELPPRRYCVVKRMRAVEKLRLWPGASEALETYRAWRGAAKAPKPAEQKQPTLHLVIDNTRVH